MHSAIALRDKLHRYIDAADEQKLKALYVLLETDIEKGATYSRGEMEELYERRRQHLSGEGETYRAEESISRNESC